MNLGLHILHNPAGTYHFVGSVPIELSFYRKDGESLTPYDIEGIQQCGAGLFVKTIGRRTWKTQAEAKLAAESAGYKVAS